MKRLAALLLSVSMLISVFSGCASPSQTQPKESEKAAVEKVEAPASAESKTVEFTDSVGRKVQVPSEITKVAISGPIAQIAVFALAPDKLAGIAAKWDKTAEEYLKTEYYNLPLLGQLYGGKGELNMESLLSSGAQVVIDVGEPKKTIVEDLDKLQEQTGIPFIHITATNKTMGDAYRQLGTLLNMKTEAEVLATYCDNIYTKTLDISNSVEKVNLLYCLGDQGLNVIAKGSYHSEVIDMLSNNLAVVDSPTSKGTGNEVDMEQIMLWNPDVILFAPDSIYKTVGSEKAWQQIKAIKNNKYYEVPFGPYNWLGFPPSVQRFLGMVWMSQLLYPEKAQYDMFSEVKNSFKLFYHSDITEEQYNKLVANSIGKK